MLSSYLQHKITRSMTQQSIVFALLLMAGASGTYRMAGKSACRVWWKNLKERGHFEDTEVNGRIILEWAFKI